MYFPGPWVNLEFHRKALYKAPVNTASAPRGGPHTGLLLFSDLPPHELSIHSYLGPIIQMHKSSMLLRAIITTYVKNKRWWWSSPAFKMATSSNSLAVMNKPARVVFWRLHSTRHLLVPNRMGLHSIRQELLGKNPSWWFCNHSLKNNQSIIHVFSFKKANHSVM